jgi:hypothetical protein
MADKLPSNNFSDRIRALKSARSKSILENRKAVYNETSGLKSRQATKRKLEEEDAAVEEEEAHINVYQKNSTTQKNAIDVSSLSYTAEDDDQWRAKQGRIKTHTDSSIKEKSQLQNYKQLAEKTFSKRLKELENNGNKKTLEEYNKEKEVYIKLKAKGFSPEEIRSKLTSTEKIDEYVDRLKKWEKNVYQKRLKLDINEGKDGAIHEKNRQFNSKLKRHYENIKKSQT